MKDYVCLETKLVHDNGMAGDCHDQSPFDADALARDAQEQDIDPRTGAIRDCFAPPDEPCECYCLHCGRVFMSEQMWFQRVISSTSMSLDGFWMCPTPNCDGAGFTFDIFPTDPDHPANGDGYDTDDDDEPESVWTRDRLEAEDLRPAADWDPDEPQYAAMDEDSGDIEGEEWKFGLQPGESLPEPEWRIQAREEWEARQRRYDEPDERPRMVDLSDQKNDPDLIDFSDDLPQRTDDTNPAEN